MVHATSELAALRLIDRLFLWPVQLFEINSANVSCELLRIPRHQQWCVTAVVISSTLRAHLLCFNVLSLVHMHVRTRTHAPVCDVHSTYRSTYIYVQEGVGCGVAILVAIHRNLVTPADR